MKVDITVIKEPVDVIYECPHCECDSEIDYSGFCSEIGEPCDWQYSIFECPNCGKKIEIDGVDWD